MISIIFSNQYVIYLILFMYKCKKETKNYFIWLKYIFILLCFKDEVVTD